MKKYISLIILLFSTLVIFNLCFFLCVDYDGNTRAWVCYLFFHLAYILSILGYYFTTRRKFGVLNSGLYAISFIYLIITTITCIIFLSDTDFSTELEIFVFLIELLFYLLSFHYCYLTNRKSEMGIINDLKNASQHESWISDLRLLANMSNDEGKKRIITSIIDEIRSCPSLSNPYVSEVDDEIQSLVRMLKSNYSKMQIAELDDYRNQICSTVRKRTEILKYSYNKM